VLLNVAALLMQSIAVPEGQMCPGSAEANDAKRANRRIIEVGPVRRKNFVADAIPSPRAFSRANVRSCRCKGVLCLRVVIRDKIDKRE